MIERFGAREESTMNRTLWTAALSCLSVLACGGNNPTGKPGTTSVPGGYETLCDQKAVTCQTAAIPSNLKGTYSGTGSTVATSNENWLVGDSYDFTAVITTQNGETGAGTLDLGFLHLDIKQATIRGDASQFTIYDTDAYVDSNCSLEVRVVITGTLATVGSTTTAAGQVVLEFTTNIQGTGCTQDQINNYPGTGATFTYTATRTP
jgi:hypothetical protein